MRSASNRRKALEAFSGLGLVAACGGLRAQEPWPSRPVRIIVPSSPGGGTDLYARLLAQALSEATRQQFLVENRPGASGNIGAAAAAKAPPDGYTLLVSANPALTINPNLYQNLPFDAERDFVPIVRVMGPLLLVVHPSLPVRNFAQWVEAGRREPGKLSYGSAGTGSPTYLGVRMVEEKTGARFLHVPYKGVGPAYQDLLGGQIQFMFPDLASALPHIRSGKVIPVAVDQASSLLPGVPTISSSGLPDYSAPSAFALVAPSATPAAIIERLVRETEVIHRAPAFVSRVESMGLVAMNETQADLIQALRKERADYGAFIRRNAIVASD